MDITQEKKDLPHAILEAMPISELLLLGFKETPEQSSSAQSEEEFGEKAEEKLKNIQSELDQAKIKYDSKLIFTHKISDQIKEVIEEEKLEFILTLKPLSELNQIVVPIYDISQINTKLNTIIYNLHSEKPMKIKALLFTNNEEESASETQLKMALKNQLSLVNIYVDDYEVYEKEKASSREFIEKISEKGDLVIYSEAKSSQKDFFLNIILEKESTNIDSPTIMILNKDRD